MNTDSPQDEGLTLPQARRRIVQLSEELSRARERVQQLELHLDIALSANRRLQDRERDKSDER